MVNLFDAVAALFLFLYSCLILTVAYVYIQKMKRSRQERVRQKFFKTLLEGIKGKDITTYDDLIHVYEGVSGLNTEEINYRYGLSRDLKIFLVALLNRDTTQLPELKNDHNRADIKVKVDEFIKTVGEISPFADLPAPERNILSDISVFIEKGENKIVQEKMLDLAGMIKTRHSSLKKYEESSKWTTPITILSIVITIVFGLLTIIK